MSAQDLSFSELATATEPFVTGDFAIWWRAHPSGQMFAPGLDRQRSIIITAPIGSSEIARLTDELSEEDAFHDDALRFGYMHLSSYTHFHIEDIRQVARRMQALIMPDGLALVNKSYEEEAGRLEAREKALTPEVRDTLSKFKLVEWEDAPLTFLQWHEEVLQASTRRLAALLQERKRVALVSGGPSPEALLNAKRALIRIVGQIFAGFETAWDEIDPVGRAHVEAARTIWNAEVAKATAAANARRRARKKAQEKKAENGGDAS